MGPSQKKISVATTAVAAVPAPASLLDTMVEQHATAPKPAPAPLPMLVDGCERADEMLDKLLRLSGDMKVRVEGCSVRTDHVPVGRMIRLLAAYQAARADCDGDAADKAKVVGHLQKTRAIIDEVLHELQTTGKVGA